MYGYGYHECILHDENCLIDYYLICPLDGLGTLSCEVVVWHLYTCPSPAQSTILNGIQQISTCRAGDVTGYKMCST